MSCVSPESTVCTFYALPAKKGELFYKAFAPAKTAYDIRAKRKSGKKNTEKSTKAGRKCIQTVTELSKRKSRQTNETGFKKQGQRGRITKITKITKDTG